YEHCSYFSTPAMDALLRRTGYRPDRSWTEFGGQFLCVEAEAIAEPSAPTGGGHALEGEVRAFPARASEKIDRWNRLLDRLVGSGRRVAVWGAGSKGTTFLNLLEAGGDVGQVVDINPRKAGRHIPGTGQRVVTPDEMEPPDVVIVMNPEYRVEIGDLLGARAISAELLVA
ncbi:MAG: hypothetical protein Q8K72_19095, partial [Acidimicrobiales bacterium]|nr:hypothetical protein [Acidimicrobiales bacterium]